MTVLKKYAESTILKIVGNVERNVKKMIYQCLYQI